MSRNRTRAASRGPTYARRPSVSAAVVVSAVVVIFATALVTAVWATPAPPVRVDPEARTITIEATARGSAFRAGVGPDARYHAVVSERGRAAGRALFTTAASDAEVAAALRRLGAEDGGGVPMRAWDRRRMPFSRAPRAVVRGSPARVTVTWPGAPRAYALDELLVDPGGRGVVIRFGGNEEHDAHWDSGCIICLFSCPGGVLSNAAYTIRDYVTGATAFEPGPDFPADGVPVTITISLAAS